MKTKEPYEKPDLGTIELKAEEVLGVGCKTAGGTNVGNPQCGSLAFCNTIGS